MLNTKPTKLTKTARLLKSFQSVLLLPEHRNNGDEERALRDYGFAITYKHENRSTVPAIALTNKGCIELFEFLGNVPEYVLNWAQLNFHTPEIMA